MKVGLSESNIKTLIIKKNGIKNCLEKVCLLLWLFFSLGIVGLLPRAVYWESCNICRRTRFLRSLS